MERVDFFERKMEEEAKWEKCAPSERLTRVNRLRLFGLLIIVNAQFISLRDLKWSNKPSAGRKNPTTIRFIINHFHSSQPNSFLLYPIEWMCVWIYSTSAQHNVFPFHVRTTHMPYKLYAAKNLNQHSSGSSRGQPEFIIKVENEMNACPVRRSLTLSV